MRPTTTEQRSLAGGVPASHLTGQPHREDQRLGPTADEFGLRRPSYHAAGRPGQAPGSADASWRRPRLVPPEQPGKTGMA
jgi:hypothetical protein